MKKVIIKTKRPYHCYDRKSFNLLFNKPISIASFIQYIFDHFITIKFQDHYEIVEELTLEKAVSIISQNYERWFDIQIIETEETKHV